MTSSLTSDDVSTDVSVDCQVAEYKRRVLREEATIKSKLAEDPRDEKGLQRLVDVQLMKNDYDAVKDTLRKMIDYFPDDYRYRLMLTEVAVRIVYTPK